MKFLNKASKLTLLILASLLFVSCDQNKQGSNLDVMACIRNNDNFDETGLKSSFDIEKVCAEKFITKIPENSVELSWNLSKSIKEKTVVLETKEEQVPNSHFDNVCQKLVTPGKKGWMANEALRTAIFQVLMNGQEEYDLFKYSSKYQFPYKEIYKNRYKVYDEKQQCTYNVNDFLNSLSYPPYWDQNRKSREISKLRPCEFINENEIIRFGSKWLLDDYNHEMPADFSTLEKCQAYHGIAQIPVFETISKPFAEMELEVSNVSENYLVTSVEFRILHPDNPEGFNSGTFKFDGPGKWLYQEDYSSENSGNQVKINSDTNLPDKVFIPEAERFDLFEFEVVEVKGLFFELIEAEPEKNKPLS